ncbi:MAG: hypothetical protein H3C47_05680 [Candidatus Cloacimonetes bacterium]|nr:hypothetical protein [Candidatus Cloacimonadota bacterium]
MLDTAVEQNASRQQLQAVAQMVWQFREKHKRGRLPDTVWDQICHLAQSLDKQSLSQELGISVQSLNQQLQKRLNAENPDSAFLRLSTGLQQVLRPQAAVVGLEICIQIPGIASFTVRSSAEDVSELASLAQSFLEKCSP